MVCFETKEETDTTNKVLNETVRYIAQQYELEKQSKSIDNQEQIYTNRKKRKTTEK